MPLLKKKLLILAAVFVTSTLFFWFLINRVLFSSLAAVEPVRLFFDKTEVTAPANKPVGVNIFFATKPENKISGATVSLKYPKDLLSFIPVMQDQVDTTCINNGHALTTVAHVLDNPEEGVVSLTRVLLDSDDSKLPPLTESGMFCFSTFYFQGQPALDSFPTKATVALNADEGACEIVGPQKQYGCAFSEGTSVDIKLMPPIQDGKREEVFCRAAGGTWREYPSSCADRCTSANVPDVCAQVVTPSCDCGEGKCWSGDMCMPDYVPPSEPPVTPPGKCSKKSLGDCNCDNVIDLKDFNRWRVGYTGGPITDLSRRPLQQKCDFNGDTEQDLADFNIWRTNFFKEDKIKPLPTREPQTPRPARVVNLKGVVDYQGPPEPPEDGVAQTQIEGFHYLFKVSSGQDAKVEKYGIDTEKAILLWPRTRLKPHMDEKQAVVNGLFVKDFMKYQRVQGAPVSSDMPTGQVIVIRSINIVVEYR